MGRGVWRVDATALLLSAVVAPAASAVLFLIIAGLITGFNVAGGDIGHALFAISFFIVLVAVWGAIPSLAFGGLGALIFERLTDRAVWPAWRYGVAGGLCALSYAATGVFTLQMSPAITMLIAPWAILISESEATRDLTFDTGWGAMFVTLILAGVLGGLVYKRASRVFAERG